MTSVDGRGGDMRGTAFAFQSYEPGQRKMMDGSNIGTDPLVPHLGRPSR